TLIVRTPLEIILLTLASEIVDPRLRVGGVRAGSAKGTVPDAGQVGLAIGPSRSRRDEVRCAIVRARNSWSFTIQPLGLGRNRPDQKNQRHEKQPHIAPRFRRGIPSPLDGGGW